MKKLRAIVALGRIAHNSLVTALGVKKSAAPLERGGKTTLGEIALFSSYHCSRYNTNTGVLTPEMFHERLLPGRTGAFLGREVTGAPS